ncbi:hypothetical protein BG004_001752, partial [Podila humilis]
MDSISRRLGLSPRLSLPATPTPGTGARASVNVNVNVDTQPRLCANGLLSFSSDPLEVPPLTQQQLAELGLSAIPRVDVGQIHGDTHGHLSQYTTTGNTPCPDILLSKEDLLNAASEYFNPGSSLVDLSPLTGTGFATWLNTPHSENAPSRTASTPLVVVQPPPEDSNPSQHASTPQTPPAVVTPQLHEPCPEFLEYGKLTKPWLVRPFPFGFPIEDPNASNNTPRGSSNLASSTQKHFPTELVF